MEIGKCYWQNHVDTSFHLCAPLVFNWSSAWLRTLLSNYPTFFQCAAYFHPNETCVYTPHPHPLPPPAWSHISIQSLQTFAGQMLLNPEDGFAPVRAHNHQYGNYELFHAVKAGVRLRKSKRKSEDPYAISGEKGRIIFQSAHKSSVCLEPFENHRLLTGEPNVQMYTFMHWFSCIALTLRAAHVPLGGSPWGVIITKGSTNDFIKDATPSCVLHSAPSEVPRQD